MCHKSDSTYTHKLTHTHTHTYTHNLTHTHTHTYTHNLTHTHKERERGAGGGREPKRVGQIKAEKKKA